MKRELAVVPYRAFDELETLRRENEELRAELTVLKGEELYPFSDPKDACRKCGAQVVTVQGAVGPLRTFEPARTRWFELLLGGRRKTTPERFRLSCTHCGAVYYERTKT